MATPVSNRKPRLPVRLRQRVKHIAQRRIYFAVAKNDLAGSSNVRITANCSPDAPISKIRKSCMMLSLKYHHFTPSAATALSVAARLPVTKDQLLRVIPRT